MNKKNLICLFSVIALIATALQFVSFEWLISMLKSDFSTDGVIETHTLNHYRTIFVFLKIFSIVFPVICIMFLTLTDKIGFLLDKVINYIYAKLRLFYDKITLSSLFWVSLFFIILLAFFAVLNFDIGQDEAFLLNDIQNIQTTGAVTRIQGETVFSYDIPSLPLNVISNFSVRLFGFSVVHIRMIILFFSCLLIVLLLKLFNNKVGIILIPLIFLFPGVFYLTSVVYLETTAFLFIVLGLIFLKKFEERNKNRDFLLSAFMMANAIATKFQLFLWIGLILFVLLLVDYKKNSLQIFKYALVIYSFFGLLFTITFFHYGYINGIKLFKFMFIGGNSAGAFGLNYDLIINKSLMLNEMIFLPLFLFIWVKSWGIIKNKYNQLYMKFIYIGAIVIVLHWLFFFGVMTWRNVFIGLSFNAILFALYLKENLKTAKLIIIPYILLGITTNYGFIKNGVVDDVQYYRSHVLDKPLTINSENLQSEFFMGAKKIIKKGDLVYAPVQPFLPRLFLTDNKVLLLEEYTKSGGNNYLIIYPGAVKENYIENRGFWPLLQQSKKLMQKGGYALYLLP